MLLSGSPLSSWTPLKLGAGGQITGIDIAPDGTMVIRGDGSGCNIWDTTLNRWRQLITNITMPSGTVQIPDGGWECKVAYSNSKRIYFIDNSGYMYRSDDKGFSFVKTNMTRLTGSVFTTSGTNTSPQKFFQGKMIVDPNNADIVYVSNSDGIHFTNDAGVTSSLISTTLVPAPLSSWSSGMAFDTSGGTVTVGGQTRTKNVILSSYGNGLYLSTSGGGTEAVDWALITGSPTTVYNTSVDPTGPAYYVSDLGGSWTLNKYQAAAWTTLKTTLNASGNYPIAVVDPATPGRFILCCGQGGWLYTNYGSTVLPSSGSPWNVIYPGTGVQPVKPSDIPWLAGCRDGSVTGYSIFFGGGAQINPQDGMIYITDGIGVWKATWPSTFVAFNVTSQSVGIEELVSNEIIAPSGPNIIVANWDRALFSVSKSLPSTYPATYGPLNSHFNAGWDVDYASSDPTFIAARCFFGIQTPADSSGYSTDSGNTWHVFPNSAPSTQQDGCIAASTPQNIVMIAGAGQKLYNTKNQAATAWNQPATATQTDWLNGNNLNAHLICADRVLANTFYAFYYGAGTSKLYVSTDGGDTWTTYVATAINSGGGFSHKLHCAPGNAGHLWSTTGVQGSSTASTPAEGTGIAAPPNFLWRCTDGGVLGNTSWQSISVANGYSADVKGVIDLGFGAIASGATYPTIYIIGYVGGVYGIWRSTDAAQTWTNIGYPPIIDFPKCIAGDMDYANRCYMGMTSGSWVYQDFIFH